MLANNILKFYFTVQLVVTIASASENKASNNPYPVRNLGASIEASQAQTTVVAVQATPLYTSKINEDNDIDVTRDPGCDDDNSDCIVILSRTPTPSVEATFKLQRSRFLCEDGLNSNNGSTEASDDNSEINKIQEQKNIYPTSQLLPISFSGPIQVSNTRESNTINILNPSAGLCIAMTGFSPDVNNIIRTAATAASSHEQLYGGQNLNVHRIVRDVIGPKLQRATQGETRPYGIQSLVVGWNSHILRSDQAQTISSSLSMYSLDPTGLWQHWGGGATCIGKYSTNIRKRLHQLLKEGKHKGESISGWKQALNTAMKSLILEIYDGNDREQNIEDTDEEMKSSTYDAVVIFGSSGISSNDRQTHCAVIPSDVVIECYRNIVKERAGARR